MNILRNKSIILLVSFLFLSLSYIPMITAETPQTEQTFPVHIRSIDETIEKTETLFLNQEEILSLQTQLQLVQDNIGNAMDLQEILEILIEVFNTTSYPILSRILTKIIDADLLLKGKLVVSKGWCRQLNPFSDGEISMMKTISIFRYREDMQFLNIPSTTTIIDLDPFDVKSFTGNQIGVLYRFKGIFIHLTTPFPNQSFRYILGVSRFATGIEF